MTTSTTAAANGHDTKHPLPLAKEEKAPPAKKPEARALPPPRFEPAVPIASIHNSTTNPRKTLGDLSELAESIRRLGVQQPVRLRPHKGGLELVYGQCRWEASKLAGVATIPALIGELTDDEALELQIVENLQRKEVHPLEEADGFKMLEEKFHHTIEQIAERVGKGVGYVYARRKLSGLLGGARAACEGGALPLSHALLVSRIPARAHQEEAANHGKAKNGQAAMSYVQFARYVQETFIIDLDKAPFDVADAKLVSTAGACGPCPKRAANLPEELRGDLGKRANLCTDRACWETKADASWGLQRAAPNGKQCLPDAVAKKAFGTESWELHQLRNGSGYVDLAAHVPGEYPQRTWRQALGKHLGVAPLEVILARDRAREIHELVISGQAERVVQQQRRAAKPQRESAAAARAKAKIAQANAKAAEEKKSLRAQADLAMPALLKAAAAESNAMAVLRYVTADAIEDAFNSGSGAVIEALERRELDTGALIARFIEKASAGELRQVLVELVVARTGVVDEFGVDAKGLDELLAKFKAPRLATFKPPTSPPAKSPPANAKPATAKKKGKGGRRS